MNDHWVNNTPNVDNATHPLQSRILIEDSL